MNMKPVCHAHADLSRREFVAGAAGLAASGFFFQSPSAKPHRIDVHCHFVAPVYLEFLKKNGNPGIPPPPWELNKHLDDMNKGGTATSIVSLPRPGIWYGDVAGVRKIARDVNEYNAKLIADHPGRFGMFATLPLTDIEGSLREVAYAMDTLKADGIGMKTNYEEKWLGDPLFAPLYEELNRRKAVIYTHPQDAPCCLDLVPGVNSTTIEYGTNTTRTIASLLYSGTAAKYPDIRWIFSHAGGTAPFLIQRLIGKDAAMYLRDGGVLAPGAPANPGARPTMPKGPLYELQKFYYDTANTFNPVAMRALRTVVPVSQIVFGTDFPYSFAPEIVKGLTVSGVFNAKELLAVDRENAARLLPRYRT
jgi:predicted TIM-barrel fold metal-dependent hydrolase